MHDQRVFDDCFKVLICCGKLHRLLIFLLLIVDLIVFMIDVTFDQHFHRSLLETLDLCLAEVDIIEHIPVFVFKLFFEIVVFTAFLRLELLDNFGVVWLMDILTSCWVRNIVLCDKELIALFFPFLWPKSSCLVLLSNREDVICFVCWRPDL